MDLVGVDLDGVVGNRCNVLVGELCRTHVGRSVDNQRTTSGNDDEVIQILQFSILNGAFYSYACAL